MSVRNGGVPVSPVVTGYLTPPYRVCGSVRRVCGMVKGMPVDRVCGVCGPPKGATLTLTQAAPGPSQAVLRGVSRYCGYGVAMRTHAVAVFAAALTLAGVASASAATIAKEEASGASSASLDVEAVVRRPAYTRFRVMPTGSATVQTWLRIGFGGEEAPTGESTAPVDATGSVSVRCTVIRDGFDFVTHRWSFRRPATSTAPITYRMPAIAKRSKCTFGISVNASGPDSTEGPYLPTPEYPNGSKTGTKTIGTVARVVVTSLR